MAVLQKKRLRTAGGFSVKTLRLAAGSAAAVSAAWCGAAHRVGGWPTLGLGVWAGGALEGGRPVATMTNRAHQMAGLRANSLWVAQLVVVLAVLFSGLAISAGTDKDRRRVTQEEETALRSALDSAGRRVVADIEAGKPEDLLRSISAGGLSVGIDAEPTGIAVIRKQFRERRLSYCFFFDTDCYQEESEAARRKAGGDGGVGGEVSLREEFKRHPQKEIFISSFRRDGDSWHGGVSVVLDPKLTRARFAPSNVVDLGFKYESAKWKLADLQFNAM